MIRNFTARLSILTLLASGIAVSAAPHIAQADDISDKQQIQQLISSAYDKPGHKVETSPIAVTDGYAIADWTQGKRGGRALLHRIDGKWAITACGADALKEVKSLTDAGISTQTAKSLVLQLTEAERSVDSDRLKRFGLFGTKDDPIAEEYHHSQHDH